MNSHNSQIVERAVLLVVLLVLVVTVYSCLSPKIQDVLQKTADQVETVGFQQTAAVKER